MTNISNSVITTLLGWIRGLVSWCWQAFTDGNTNGFLGWIGHHWILLTVLLCIIGLAIDLIVYLFRWRPHLVWQSFYARLTNRQKIAEQLSPVQPDSISHDEQKNFVQTSVDPNTEQSAVPSGPPKRRRIWLTETLMNATKDQGMDEQTRLATYRPNMKTSHTEAFRQPVYPDPPAEEITRQPE